MEIALNTSSWIIASHKQPVHGFTSRSSRFHLIWISRSMISQEYHPAVCAVISGAEDVGVSSSQFDDFSVAATSTSKARELMLECFYFRKLLISVEVFGAKNQAILTMFLTKWLLQHSQSWAFEEQKEITLFPDYFAMRRSSCANLDRKIKAKHKEMLGSSFSGSLNAVNLTANINFHASLMVLNLFCFTQAA
ncbi:trigger factor [Fagus crenata]